MTLLTKSKNYFTSLSNKGVEEANDALEFYEELKESGQEFGAAKFIVEVYKDFTESMNNYGSQKTRI